MYKRILTFVTCLLLGFVAMAQVTVKGKVIGPDGLGLPGVNVVEKANPSNGTATDIDGNWTLTVPSGNSILEFSSIGMKTVELAAKEAKQVTMKDDSQMLEEVVVVGFGKQKKENLTGAVATVDAKVLENRPVNNVTQALQGAVAGMNFSVGTSGGELSNGMNINIRGAGTIGDGSKASPLILIDGVEGDLNSLNPQDIENISVLKDAASSSIYGSRAAFGVILVTTKKGKEGNIVINYSTNYRLSSPLLEPKMLDSERFAYYRNDAAFNSGRGAIFSKETIEKIIQHKQGTLADATEWNPAVSKWLAYNQSWADINWFKEIYQTNAPSWENNISVRGGNSRTNYFFSANGLTQEGLMRYNTDERDRYSINARISSQILPYLRMTYGGRFTRVKYSKPTAMIPLLYHQIARAWPTLPLKDPNGNYFWENYVENLENGGRSKSEADAFVQQLEFVFTPIKNWNTHIQLNYTTKDNFDHNVELPVYKYGQAGEREKGNFYVFWGGQNGKVTEKASKTNFFSPNIYSDYSFSLKDAHNFKVMAGFQSELNKGRSFYASRQDLYTPEVTTINTTYGEEDHVGGDFQHWATAGFFGRINYNYKGIYLLELNGRYDGTSRFLRDKRWNFFPSASVGYNITKENYWEELGGFAEKINTLKLRASYGVLGNQNTSNWYPFYSKMPLGVANGAWLINGTKTNTSGMPGLVSTLLTWERVKSWNIGLDLNMLNNRLGLVFDYFKRTTYDMVGPAPELPATLGTGVPKINNTDMESKGFELEVSWRDRIGDDFTYGVRAILTDSKQTVAKYPNETGTLKNYYSGRKLGEIWGYTSVGIAKTDAEMTEHLKNNQPSFGGNWAAGDVMYKDLNGDGKVSAGAYTKDEHGDLTIIGNSTPRYNFGISLDCQYKGFDFSAFFQGTGKRDLSFGYDPKFVGTSGNQWASTAYEEHLDYFRPEDTKSPLGPNVNSYYPRPLFGGWKNYQTQTRWLQDASYIRLKNIQLGYTLPLDITEKIGVNKLRAYISAENICTWTKLSEIFDPETTDKQSWYGNGKIYPLSKTVSIGLSVTF